MPWMLLAEIAATSADVAATSSRLAKVERIADCLAGATARRRSGSPSPTSRASSRRGRSGSGGRRCASCRRPRARHRRSRCSRSMLRCRACRRSPARARRRRAARSSPSLLGRATEPEQRLLVGLFLGELRQGALEGVMADAVAKAADVPAAEVRRAAMLAGDLRDGRRGGDARRLRRPRRTSD